MSEFIDRLEADIRNLQKNFRESDLSYALQDLNFKSSQAKIDFQAILLAGASPCGAGYEGPNGLSLKEFAKQQFELRPELHRPQPQDEKPTEVPAAAPNYKAFQIEQITPNMTDAQVQQAWSAIQRASGIEPPNRRYRNE